ncbi:IS1-like element transposase [Enterobacter bugandensis]
MFRFRVCHTTYSYEDRKLGATEQITEMLFNGDRERDTAWGH